MDAAYNLYLHVPAKEASEKFAPTRDACTSEASGHWVKLKWPATGQNRDIVSATDMAMKARAAGEALMLQPGPSGPCDRHGWGTMGDDVTISALR